MTIKHKFDRVHYWIAVGQNELDSARASERQACDKLDSLLQACPDPECPVCAEIVCPHHDCMHFHHDGCPSCAQDEEDEQTDSDG